MKETMNQIKILILVGIVILIGQKVKMGNDMNIAAAIPGMLLVLLVALISMKIKEIIPNCKIPAFAWASLIALLLSMPYCPVNKYFLYLTDKVDFLAIGTGILAFAGISVGNKLNQLKKLSWKIVLISFVVFCGTYFGSAIVSQVILKAQGII